MTECEHGSLKRACPICERDDEIAKLRALNAELVEALRFVALYLDGMKVTGRKEKNGPILTMYPGEIARAALAKAGDAKFQTI
jgi:hypothetical protein